MTNVHDLKTIGLKATGPRLRILKLFESSKVRHLSAEDVYRILMTEGLDVGLATVYRVLTQFEQAGILQRHHFESGKAVFELNEGTHHDHLVCIQCGRLPAPPRPLESLGRLDSAGCLSARRGKIYF